MAGNERPRGGRTEPAVKQMGASIPMPPLRAQLTGVLINELLNLCQKLLFQPPGRVFQGV